MPSDRIPGSFRDPSGTVFGHEGRIYRRVNPSYRDHYDLMMRSGFYRSAVDDRLLIPHDEVSPDGIPGTEGAYKILRPERIGFISYPYEWSFTQLKDAALLTLLLQKRALDFGLSLKDASAFNVQFHRGRPVFIDTLSFEPYPEGRPWVAYQQFCRHFLAPLALMAHRHPDLVKLSRVHVDGIPLDLAARLLPIRTRLIPSLFVHLHLHARAQRVHGGRPASAERARRITMSRTSLRGLLENLESCTRRLSWEPARTQWANYYDETNYTEQAQRHKAALVARILDDAKPGSVWDLGANVGRFSRIASERGIPTVAFDVDPAAVEKNYLACRKTRDEHLLPLVLDLENPSPGLGWSHEERASLEQRGPADVAMALALIHHLAIGNNVPLQAIAAFLRRLARASIVEFVPKSDSQVQRMLASREDVFPDYDPRGFEEAFSQHFSLRKREPIQGTGRVVYYFEGR